jgi:hypothetical protein
VWRWLPNPYQGNTIPQRIGTPIVGSIDVPERNIDIDMDGDGTIDFKVQGRYFGYFGVLVLPQGTNEVLGVSEPPPDLESYATALSREDKVSFMAPPGSEWLPILQPYNLGPHILACSNPGEWCNGFFLDRRAYVGVRFWARDGLHYGVLDVAGRTEWALAILYGYGYNRVAGAPLDISEIPGEERMHPPRIVRPGYIRLEWDSVIGKGYELQSKEFWWWYWIESGVLINATATNTVVDIPLTGTAQFFRLMRMD